MNFIRSLLLSMGIFRKVIQNLEIGKMDYWMASLVCFFETGSCCVTQAGLEHVFCAIRLG
jgi:hypothetical protein